MLLVGCGRKGFSGVDAGDDTVDTPLPTDAEIDAPLICTNDDGVCLFGCADEGDTDCITSCGDGKCIGNANELCTSCAQDCMTMSIVCGNGACDSGEAAAGCYADCGPASWPWVAEEMQLMNMINATRTAGKKCPGPGGILTAPALTIDPTLQPPAREWAWEIAHQNYWMSDGSACNGRTYQQREVQGGFTQYITAYGFPDVTATFNDWLSNQTTCDLVMDANLTTMNVAVAFDLQKGYIFVIK